MIGYTLSPRFENYKKFLTPRLWRTQDEVQGNRSVSRDLRHCSRYTRPKRVHIGPWRSRVRKRQLRPQERSLKRLAHRSLWKYLVIASTSCCVLISSRWWNTLLGTFHFLSLPIFSRKEKEGSLPVKALRKVFPRVFQYHFRS